LLAGCVTYYYPETALEDGVYYAGDDPSYVFNSGDYSGVVYYPWSSLDYFYMGYWPYPGHGYVYGYPYGIGYSPWHYPYGYYGYYSERYFSYRYYSYWRPYQGYCAYPGNCRPHYNGDRYSLEEPGRRRRGQRDGEDEEGEEFTLGVDSDIRKYNGPSAGRYVTTAPPGYAGNQGMVIRSSGNSKIGKSRQEPARPVRSKPVSARSSTIGTISRSPATSSMSTRSTRSTVVSSPSNRRSSGKSKASRRKDRD
jgi:hypothetical protein